MIRRIDLAEPRLAALCVRDGSQVASLVSECPPPLPY